MHKHALRGILCMHRIHWQKSCLQTTSILQSLCFPPAFITSTAFKSMRQVNQASIICSVLIEWHWGCLLVKTSILKVSLRIQRSLDMQMFSSHDFCQEILSCHLDRIFISVNDFRLLSWLLKICVVLQGVEQNSAKVISGGICPVKQAENSYYSLQLIYLKLLLNCQAWKIYNNQCS